MTEADLYTVLCFSLHPSFTHLVPADFLERPVDVEQGQVVSFAGGELLAHGQHLVPPCGRVVQHGVHRQQRHDAQDLL